MQQTFCSHTHARTHTHTHTTISLAHYTAIRLNPNVLRRSRKHHPPDETMCQMYPAQTFTQHCSGVGLEIYNMPPMGYDKPRGRLVISNTSLKSLKKFSKLASLPLNFLISRNKSFFSMKRVLHRVVCMAQHNTWTDG